MYFVNGTFNVIEKLRYYKELATKPNPPIKPLIVDNSYFIKIVSIYQYYGLFLYYAYYGRGKTYGVGYKLYHESHPNYGSYKEEYNVIFINARKALVPTESPIVKFITQVKGTDPITSLIGGILYAGLNPSVCKEIGSPSCLSTFSLYDNKLLNKILNYVPDPENVSKNGWSYLVDIIRNVNKITRKSTIIVIDEFEYWITERFFQPFRRFVADLADKIRSYHDSVGVLDFKTILLVQKAIIDEAEIQYINKMFDIEPRIKAAKGITYIDEIKHYNIDVYINYIIESLGKLYMETYEPQFAGLKELVMANRDKIRKKLEFIETVPPRIAFGIIDRFIRELTRQKIHKHQRLSYEIILNAINDLLKQLETAGSIWRLYSIIMEKSKIITERDVKRNLPKIVDFISGQILHGMSSSYPSSFLKMSYIIKKMIGITEVKSKKEEQEYNFDIRCILFRAAISRLKDVEKDAKFISNNIINAIKKEIKLLSYEKKGIPKKISITLYPMIYYKSQDIEQMIELYRMIKSLLSSRIETEIINSVGKNQNAKSFRPETIVGISEPFIIDDDAIIVLYLLVKHDYIDSHFKDYIDNRKKEILNEIRSRWNL